MLFDNFTISISKFSDLTQVFQIYFSIKHFFPTKNPPSPWKPHIDTPHIFALPAPCTPKSPSQHNPQPNHLSIAFRLPICYVSLFPFFFLIVLHDIFSSPQKKMSLSMPLSRFDFKPFLLSFLFALFYLMSMLTRPSNLLVI